MDAACLLGINLQVPGPGEPGVGVAQDMTDPDTAYARFPAHRPSRYRDGRLSGPPSANAS